jgi:transposase
MKMARLSYCPDCLHKQQQIDRLQEELRRVKDRLRYQERTAKEGPFGSSTPSSKVPIKPNAPTENPRRKGGATQGHRGRGRQAAHPESFTREQTAPGPDRCPDCGGLLEAKGCKERTVLDLDPARKQIVRHRLPQGWCAHCRRTVAARPEGVFPKNLLGNQLLAHVAVEHFVFGSTLGHLSQRLSLRQGTLHGAMHQLARRLESAGPRLLEDWRQAAVKHADETGWRNDGRNGYAWLFCTPQTSLYCLRLSRSAKVAAEVFGPQSLPGTLVVDRYAGYNRAPCALQYCYAHLDREVRDLANEFPTEAEVVAFAGQFRPLLAEAMRLRGQGLERAAFDAKAAALVREIRAQAATPARHPGIQKIQNIFREQDARLFHWAKDPAIPAENNRAERELRPLVIARKISFGSQSDQGSKTREILMSVLHTLRKRTADVTAAFKRALDDLARNPATDPYQALFGSG